MIALLISGAVAFAVAVTGTPTLIRVLEARGIGQQIRDDGPLAHPHVAKAGTPTMGGIALVAAALLGYLAAHVRSDDIKFSRSGVTLIALILAMAVVGFVDDYLGVRKGRNLGLRKRGKTAGQLLVAGGFALIALSWVQTSTTLSFTRIMDVELGSALWCALAILVIYGTTNAVNLTDGLDGLAAGVSTLVFAAFVIIAFWQFRHPDIYGAPGAIGTAANATDLSVVAAAMMGACAGFLWWNAAPARIFMGDTGALAIGAGVAGLSLLTNTILLLPILGGLYVFETLSVIVQIMSFRLFRRRVFRMAPIHHHFELAGWPEFTVIVRFWLIAGMFVGLALGLFYADFIRIPGVIE